ncbi:hypothetical protein MTO96_018965 [Rhipicephalus appendiculatus]
MFETYLLASGATEFSPERRRPILTHCLGTEGKRIFNTLPVPAAATPSASADKFDANYVCRQARRKCDANCTECVRRNRRGASATPATSSWNATGSIEATIVQIQRPWYRRVCC